MKKVLVVLAFAFLGNQAFAQTNEIEMFQSIFKVEKKALLMDFLKLSEEDATAFWPVYEAFEADRQELAKKRIALIYKYAEEYETLDAEQADELAMESFKIRAAHEKLHKSYYKKVKKAVGAIRAAQCIQFERFIDNEIDNQVNSNMPLIGEFN